MSRRLLAVPAAAVLAWSLTACGGAAPEAPTSPSPSASASATQEAVVESTGFELTTETMDELTAAMLAAQTYDTSMVTEVGGASMTAQGQARVTEAGSELTMTTSSPDMPTPVEIRLVGGQMYVNMGELTGGLFWQIDAADTSNPIAAAMAQSTAQSSAADSLAALVPALVSVEKSGAEEQLDGVTTQPYDVVVDTSKLAGQAAEQFASAAESGVEIPAQITYRYWIGTDQLPRKLTLDMLGSHIEMSFSNWGGPVTIEAPPADQVTAAPTM
ncbi:hypothetical protein [Cellulomonas xylanilytica]|uniref:hypothetical protein n=1 Tax=Cellulomonas xylanilytica TaxID=233583 RepID=UPI0011BD7683|nr:hypothetical protein [Cellulomonas xylanilytica]